MLRMKPSLSADRWSAPTFLSALGLLEMHWTDPPLVLELACGIGQILREVAGHGVAVAGIDVVFSKLWLARHFVVPDAPLVCADVTAGLPLVKILLNIAGLGVVVRDLKEQAVLGRELVLQTRGEVDLLEVVVGALPIFRAIVRVQRISGFAEVSILRGALNPIAAAEVIGAREKAEAVSVE